MKVSLYNTFSRTVEELVPIDSDEVKLYACGPTVYNYAHIGNLRTYIFEDVLRRVLEYAGFRVNHVMNITDVGHLTSDEDEGEDKMVKSSRETGRSVWEIARLYTDAFFRDTDLLNILRPSTACRATDHIEDMITLIQRLERKGHTYTSGGNVYFSIDTFPRYGRLAGLKLEELQSGARIEVDENKRNPKDFVLWFTNSKFENQAMIWDSPWGKGYPGWHIECSAMSMKYLGEHFDIHCGGTDHINVHHTNEIAQSEAATGKKWVNYWLHGEFLIDETGKMSKSRGEFMTLALLMKKGYDPLDYRYFCLGAHYRTQLQFSWEALDAARNARIKLIDRIARLIPADIHQEMDNLPENRGCFNSKEPELPGPAKAAAVRFDEYIGRDLNIPRGLAEVWIVLKNPDLEDEVKLAAIGLMDRVLGLGLLESAEKKHTDRSEGSNAGDSQFRAAAEALIDERAAARKSRNYSRADEIRDILEKMGIEIQDTPSGTVWRKTV